MRSRYQEQELADWVYHSSRNIAEKWHCSTSECWLYIRPGHQHPILLKVWYKSNGRLTEQSILDERRTGEAGGLEFPGRAL